MQLQKCKFENGNFIKEMKASYMKYDFIKSKFQSRTGPFSPGIQSRAKTPSEYRRRVFFFCSLCACGSKTICQGAESRSAPSSAIANTRVYITKMCVILS